MTGLHVPSLPGTSHAVQRPSQAVAQQRPSAQVSLAQTASRSHFPPSATLNSPGTEWEMKTLPSGSVTSLCLLRGTSMGSIVVQAPAASSKISASRRSRPPFSPPVTRIRPSSRLALAPFGCATFIGAPVTRVPAFASST